MRDFCGYMYLWFPFFWNSFPQKRSEVSRLFHRNIVCTNLFRFWLFVLHPQVLKSAVPPLLLYFVFQFIFDQRHGGTRGLSSQYGLGEVQVVAIQEGKCRFRVRSQAGAWRNTRLKEKDKICVDLHLEFLTDLKKNELFMQMRV